MCLNTLKYKFQLKTGKKVFNFIMCQLTKEDVNIMFVFSECAFWININIRRRLCVCLIKIIINIIVEIEKPDGK